MKKLLCLALAAMLCLALAACAVAEGTDVYKRQIVLCGLFSDPIITLLANLSAGVM